MAVATRTRRDIQRVQRHDALYGNPQEVLRARIAAVLGAQRALAQREAGAVYAFRASLVDLAAVSEALAGDLRAASR